MKLLFCYVCHDVFKLAVDEIRSCACGKVRGRYINNSEAEVNGEGYSLAIGNGSLMNALYSIKEGRTELRPVESEVICWVRPHEGPANPHTKVNKDL